MAATSQSEATQAAAGVDARRTVGNAERDQTTTRVDQIVDTGADEAHMASILDQTRAWNANSKMLFEETLKALKDAQNEAASHSGGLNTIREQLLQTMVVNTDNSQKGYLRHLSLQDRSVFTAENELEASLAAKTGVQQDALATVLVNAVAQGVAQAMAAQAANQ